jgi:riboflavin biosynthesis pyrimidine reductase
MHLLRTGGDELTDADLVDLYPRVPGVRVNFVASLDGAVSVEGSSEKLSGPADKRVFRLLRMLCDTLLVGAGTLRREAYRPLRLDADRRTWRREHGLPEYPRLVVVSARLDLDPAAPVFAEAPVRPLIITHAGAPGERKEVLDRVADVLVCGETQVDWPEALDHLAGRAVLCEGGPRLFGALTGADAVDELCVTVAGLLAGPGADRMTVGPSTVPQPMRLRHILVEDDTLLLRYVRSKPTRFPMSTR